MIANVLCFLLLIIEGRRYRYYVAFRARVRMLEAHLIMPAVLQDVPLRQGDWRKLMAEDLVRPTFKMGRLDAIASRLRRNHVYIFAIVAAGWFLKRFLHEPGSHRPDGFLVALLHDNPLPGWIFTSFCAAFYLVPGFLLFRAFKGDGSSGDFLSGAMRRKQRLE